MEAMKGGKEQLMEEKKGFEKKRWRERGATSYYYRSPEVTFLSGRAKTRERGGGGRWGQQKKKKRVPAARGLSEQDLTLEVRTVTGTRSPKGN